MEMQGGRAAGRAVGHVRESSAKMQRHGSSEDPQSHGEKQAFKLDSDWTPTVCQTVS